jgi:serine/threonine protein kinase
MKLRKRFSENESKYILGQIINGFREINSNGIIHRDLKPQNVMINFNNMSLADFISMSAT